MAEEEGSSGILGTAALVGTGIAGLVFRRNIGKFVRDYAKELEQVTDPDALLKKKRKIQVDENRKKFFGAQEETSTGIEQVAPKQDIVPVDKVDEIINPTPMSPGEVARKEAQNIFKAENQILMDIKRETRKQPLTLGGMQFNNDMYGVGSVLFDAVAKTSNSAKPMPVSYWKDLFKKKLTIDFVPTGNSRKISTTVAKDEIADANIAFFDKNGKLTDGYLKYIEDMNEASAKENEILISPITILNLIKRAPGNNLRVVEYDSKFYADDTETLNSFGKAILEGLEKKENLISKLKPGLKSYKKLLADGANTYEMGQEKRLRELQNVRKKVFSGEGMVRSQRSAGVMRGGSGDQNPGQAPRDTAYALKTFRKKLIEGNFDATDEGANSMRAFFDLPVSSLGYKGKYKVDPNMTIGDALEEYNTATIKYRDVMKDMFSKTPASMETKRKLFDVSKSYKEVSKLMNKLPHVKYPNVASYRLFGPEDYFESVIYIDPANIEAVRKVVPNFSVSPRHYHNDVFGKSTEGQILHLRGGTRQVDSNYGRADGKPMRALTIDEMQSDINQSVQKAIKREKTQLAKNRLDAELDAIREDENLQREFTKFKDEGGLQRFVTEQAERTRVGGRPTNTQELLNTMDQLSDDQKFRMFKDSKFINLTDKELGELTSKPSNLFKDKYMFTDLKEQNIRRNMFNLEDLNSNLYRDRMLTIADEIEGLTNKGLKMTRKDIDQVNKLQTKFEEIKELIPSVNNRQASQYPYIPFYKKEQWGALGLKYAIRKAAKEDLDYVTINPYEIVHHREGARLGNLEFYGNKRGGGDILERVKGTLTERQVAFIDKLAEKRGFQPGSAGYIKLLQEAAGRDPVARKALAKELNVSGVDGLRNDGKKKATAEGATLPNFLKKFAEDYGTEVESIRVAKSDPSKTVKFVDEIEIIDPDTGKPGKFEQHIAAFTEEEYEALLQSNQRPLTHIGYKVVKRKPGVYYPEDYYRTFGIKVKPEFKDVPIKGYFKGGLAQSPFKW